MIKNVILDIGGIIADDSKENIENVLNKNCDKIYRSAYGNGFKDCLIGIKELKEYINNFLNTKDYIDISFILNKDNLKLSYPIINSNVKYIKELKERGYHLYILSNITKESYEYLESILNINSIFDGGIYSYQEHLIKPDPKIYNLLFEKYNLNKNETLFFDDSEKNVKVARELGINAFLFKSINDIEKNL